MKVFLLSLLCLPLLGLSIIDKPIQFDSTRMALSKQYLQHHYGLEKDSITIIPRIIVIHATALDDLQASFNRFDPVRLLSDRKDIQNASPLNVSAHFLVDRDGQIYRLMPENWMARHVIGLNHCAIGIENVGGEEHADDLSPAQLQANQELIAYLIGKYHSIDYLIGHYEYQRFENHPLWLEQNPRYRTLKHDPGHSFMKALRHAFPTLKEAP